MLEQRLFPGFAESGHVVQRTRPEALGPFDALVGDREAVGLVTHALEQIQALTGAGQDHRVVLAGHPDLLQALGEAADGDVVDAQLVQRPLGGGDLRLAAVDDDELRRIGEPLGSPVVVLQLLAGFLTGFLAVRPLAGLLLLGDVALEAAADHLVHGPDVVLPLEALDLEAPVLALALEAVLEDDHGGHHVVALEMGDVVALDPQRGAVQVEGLGDLLQRARAGGEVGGALGLVQHERLLGVALHGLHEGLLVAALRDAQRDARPAPCRQPLLDGLHRVGQCRDKDLLGYGVALLLPVELLECVLDEGAGGDLLDLVGHPAPLAAYPPTAYVEDLHGRFQLVLGDRDQVGVGRVGEHDRALLHGLLQGLDVVAQAGRPLVLHLLGRFRHPLFEPADVRARAAGHEVAEVLGQVAVFLGRDAPHAGRRTLADVPEQAGAAGAGGVLEDAGRAGAHREDAQQEVHGVADRPGVPVRAEVADALAFLTAHHLHARELLVHRHREIRVALVVAVLDVEAGVVLLDPGVLQLERLDLRGHDRPLHGGGRGDHRAGARVEAGQVLEVVGEALAQAFRLPDVDHPAVLVAEFVHPWRVRDLSRLGAVAGGVGHVSHPTGGV